MDFGFIEWFKEFLSRNFDKKDSALVAVIVTLAIWLIYFLLPSAFLSFLSTWINEFVNKVPQAIYLILLIAICLVSWIWIKALKNRVKALTGSSELLRKELQSLKDTSKGTSESGPKMVAHLFDAIGDARFQYQISFLKGIDVRVNQARIDLEIQCKPCSLALEERSTYSAYHHTTTKGWECPACKVDISNDTEKTLKAKTKSAFVKTFTNAQG